MSKTSGERSGAGEPAPQRRRLQLEFTTVASSATPATPAAGTDLTDEQLDTGLQCIETRCFGCKNCQSEEWLAASKARLALAIALNTAKKTVQDLERAFVLSEEAKKKLCTHNLLPPLGNPGIVRCSACGITRPR